MLLKLLPLGLLLFLISCSTDPTSQETSNVPNTLISTDSNQLKDHQIPDINGVYLLGGHENSWYMILQKTKNQYSGELFELEGMLPPANYLLLNQKEFTSEKFQLSDINPTSLEFNSNLGTGKILIESDPRQIVFEEKKSHLADQLILSYNKAYQVLLK